MKLLCAISDVIAWAAVITLLVWCLAGLAHGKAKGDSFVPVSCMHSINITDFTKPCKVDPKNPNMAHCDGVIIRFACVQYNGTR